MDLTKLPPLDYALIRTDAGMVPTLAQRLPPVPGGSAAADLASSSAALIEQVRIHPLDLAGAMQILIAEVRAELPLPGGMPALSGEMPGPLPVAGSPGVPGSLPVAGALGREPLPAAEVSQILVRLFLQALPAPETLEPAAWLAHVMDVELAVPAALDRAMEAVSGWRDVPSAVVEAAGETRDAVVAALTADPPNPLWLRPEWLGLAPRMERYWRRRKRARRWLSDPDLHWREREEYFTPEPPPNER